MDRRVRQSRCRRVGHRPGEEQQSQVLESAIGSCTSWAKGEWHEAKTLLILDDRLLAALSCVRLSETKISRQLWNVWTHG
mmetsp:Transcript_13752/g.34340  ORF Transcript_13752/g.34340 Transcript_13752/m.34340 type:complete len:80 (-) Transcript_13752:193-432(-)